MTQNAGLFNANVTYTASTPTTFARVVGITTLPISGQAAASLSLNPFVDIQILMDVSASMMLAATPEDIELMQKLTKKFKRDEDEPVPDNVGANCTFACHWSATGKDYYKEAKKSDPPVKLRITVLQTAVGGLIDTLASLDTNNRFQLGLYTFSQKLNTIYDLSPDVAGARIKLETVEPDVNFCSTNCPDTYFSAAMTQLAALDQSLPQQGGQVPQRFLFLVSDGVYDQYSSAGNRQIGAFDPADCVALKALGISLLVLYTPYTSILDNSYYVQNVEPSSAQIVPNLQACASSPSYFFVANDAADINTQLQKMLQLVVQTTSHLIK